MNFKKLISFKSKNRADEEKKADLMAKLGGAGVIPYTEKKD